MRFLDIGWEARGVVAIGQFATGVIAIGQVAWGVVAIGQAAFGWLAIGQLAVGGATIGMAGVGLHGTVAMVGVGGRGLGLVLPLLPSLGTRQVPDKVQTLAAARRAGEGWVHLHLMPRSGGLVAAFDGYERVDDLRVDARVRRAALAAAPGDVWARLRTSADGPVIDQIVVHHRSRLGDPRWWLVWSAQLAALMVLSAVVWWLVGEVVLRALTAP